MPVSVGEVDVDGGHVDGEEVVIPSGSRVQQLQTRAQTQTQVHLASVSPVHDEQHTLQDGTPI